MQNWRQYLSVLLRIGLSVGILYWLIFHQNDPQKIWTAIRTYPSTGWLIGISGLIAANFLIGIRWYRLATGLGVSGSLWRFERLHFESLFFSTWLPSSIGGDVVKAFRASNNARGRVMAGYSVVADRVSGLLAVLIIGLTAMIGKSSGGHHGFMLGVILIAFSLTLFAVRIGMHSLKKFLALFSPESFVTKILQPLLPYSQRPRLLYESITLSMFVQLMGIVALAGLGWAMGLELEFAAYCNVSPIVALATALPITPSGVGIREKAMEYLLADYGVQHEQAIALALIWT